MEIESRNGGCWMAPEFQPIYNMIRVVLPVCERDARLMLDNLSWQAELDGIKPYDCLLSVDRILDDDTTAALETAAWKTFLHVEVFRYPVPPVQQWPQAPNWAFQHTATRMVPGKRSWFWMEADCIPLCPGWLDDLNHEYYSCRKPMMGVVVEGMGHCNGTAIYPSNFPSLSKAAMRCTDVAWDGEMARETIRMTHNAAHLMCHVWGIKNGLAVPYGGDPAHFHSWRNVQNWVDLNAVLFHRSKNNSLINQLRNQRRRIRNEG